MSVPTNINVAPAKSRLKRSLRATFVLLRILVLVYLALLVLLVLDESQLVFPVPSAQDANWSPADFPHQEAHFSAADGTRLHGWYLPKENATSAILICHGNAEQVAWMSQEMAEMRERYHASVFAFDYRGYGLSAGQPWEGGTFQDGEAALDWLCHSAGLAPSDIVVYGRSLGGGVAVHVAATKGARALVLERTFSSAVDVAADHYPMFPIRWLMRNQYDSLSAIRNYHGPVFQIHGTADKVIPYRFAQNLFKAAPGSTDQKVFITVPGLGHEDLLPASFSDQLGEFLQKIVPNR